MQNATYNIQLSKNIADYNKVVEQSESFYKNIEHIEINNKLHEFYIYNYRLADVTDFINFAPISFEMRGITFNDSDIVYPSIHKIFNHKENKLVEDDISCTDAFEIREKLDGSLVQPILINDTIVFKTKSTFKSEQAYKANMLLEKNKNLKKFILNCINLYGMMPLFEYISNDNQIVVYYNTSDLVLIQLRHLDTGKYADYQTLSKLAEQYQINHVKIEQDTINNILKKREVLQNIEGWIMQNTNANQQYTDFRKIKTFWYLNLHRVVACDKIAENDIITLILDETIDDILSMMQESSKKKYIENIMHSLNHYIKQKTLEIQKIYNEDLELYKQNAKAFVEKYKELDIFPVLIKVVRNGYDENRVIADIKAIIKKRTIRLSSAREFLQNILIK